MGYLILKIMEKKIEKAKSKFEIVNQWISNCDTKSSILLAFYGVLLTVVFTSEITCKISTTLSMTANLNDIGLTEIMNFISLISIIVFFVCSFLCLLFVYNTLKARINADAYSQPELKTDSNIFFLKISNKTYIDFKRVTNTEENEDYLNDLNSQIYINSKIATQKFKAYNKSLLFGFLGLISLGLYLLTA